jgi:dienelactone hydrolase
MQVPSILQGEPLKRLLQSATAGPVATMIVGFSWGGGSLGTTADKTAKEWSELVFLSLAAAIVVSVGILLLTTLHS